MTNTIESLLEDLRWVEEHIDDFAKDGIVIQKESIKNARDLARKHGFDKLTKEQRRHNFEINTAKYKRK